MSALARVLLAVIAAVTVCVAVWAGLHSLGTEPRTVASESPPLAIPELAPPPALPPFDDAPPSAVEASADRDGASARGDLAVTVRGAPISFPVELTLRSGWSRVPLARRELPVGPLPAAAFDFAGLPHGDHWLTLAPASPAGDASYLSKTRVTVPSAPLVVDLTVASLRVRVSDERGPVARALVCIERSDDPAWLQPTPRTGDDSLPLTDRSGVVVLAPLGPGGYRVRVAGEPDAAPVDVEVPATTEVEVKLRRR